MDAESEMLNAWSAYQAQSVASGLRLDWVQLSIGFEMGWYMAKGLPIRQFPNWTGQPGLK